MFGGARLSFERYVGIDYSGAGTPGSSLKGLRVFIADGVTLPHEVPPPPSPRKYWTRRGIAEWLSERLLEDWPSLVGIDHGFSFPRDYFDRHGVPLDWSAFLDDFQRHWPTDGDHARVTSVLRGLGASGAIRRGDSRWKRLTERQAGSAKSVFHFNVPGSVAHSTHAGLPWLRYLRQRVRDRVHFWPFDGWEIPVGRSAVVEVYPRLWSRCIEPEGRTADQHDAYSVVAWMQQADLDGSLAGFLNPPLRPEQREMARIEGWILGVK